MPSDIEGQIRFFINYFLHYPQRRISMFIEHYDAMENNVTSFQRVLETITGYHQEQRWHPANLTLSASISFRENYQCFHSTPPESSSLLIRRNNQEMIKWLKDLQAGYLRLQRAFAGGGPSGEAFCVWPTPLGLFVGNMIATAVTQGYPSAPLERAIRIICAMIQPDVGTPSQTIAVPKTIGVTQPVASSGERLAELRRGPMYSSVLQSRPSLSSIPANLVHYSQTPTSPGEISYVPQPGDILSGERSTIGDGRRRDYLKSPFSSSLPNPCTSFAPTYYQSSSAGILTANQIPRSTPAQTQISGPQVSHFSAPVSNHNVAPKTSVFPTYSDVVQGTAGLMTNTNRIHSLFNKATHFTNDPDEQSGINQGNYCNIERAVSQTNYAMANNSTPKYINPLGQKEIFGSNIASASGAYTPLKPIPSTSNYPGFPTDPICHSNYYQASNLSISSTPHSLSSYPVVSRQSLPGGPMHWQNSGATGYGPPPGMVSQDNQKNTAAYSQTMINSYQPWPPTATPQFTAHAERRSPTQGAETMEEHRISEVSNATTQGAQTDP